MRFDTPLRGPRKEDIVGVSIRPFGAGPIKEDAGRPSICPFGAGPINDDMG